MIHSLIRRKYLVGHHLQIAQKRSWDFKVEISGPLPPPDNVEFFIREVTHSPTTYQEQSIELPTLHYNLPKHRDHVHINLTMRDNQNEEVARWVDQCASLVMNDDGTVNLPKDYLFEFQRFHWVEETYQAKDLWQVWFQERGEVTESYVEQGFLEFPVQLIQFRS